MKTKAFFLAVSLSVLVAKPIWAQQQNPDPNLMGQLEQRLADSDSAARQPHPVMRHDKTLRVEGDFDGKKAPVTNQCAGNAGVCDQDLSSALPTRDGHPFIWKSIR